MGDDLKHVIISLGAFAGIFGIAYVFMMTRYRERMAMIERGVDASIFQGERSISPTLKFGMLFVGIALGILTAHFVHENYGMTGGASYLSMIFLFGGLSLIINFLIERRITRSEQKTSEDKQ